MTCACCQTCETTSQVRGVELCDECARFIRPIWDENLRAEASLAFYVEGAQQIAQKITALVSSDQTPLHAHNNRSGCH